MISQNIGMYVSIELHGIEAEENSVDFSSIEFLIFNRYVYFFLFFNILLFFTSSSLSLSLSEMLTAESVDCFLM